MFEIGEHLAGLMDAFVFRIQVFFIFFFLYLYYLRLLRILLKILISDDIVASNFYLYEYFVLILEVLKQICWKNRAFGIPKN